MWIQDCGRSCLLCKCEVIDRDCDLVKSVCFLVLVQDVATFTHRHGYFFLLTS